jgi:hypothetical protein
VLQRQGSLGSGVIVDPNGYIVTDNHVVAGALRIRVTACAPEGGARLNGLPARNCAGIAPRLASSRRTVSAMINLPSGPADDARGVWSQCVPLFHDDGDTA